MKAKSILFFIIFVSALLALLCKLHILDKQGPLVKVYHTRNDDLVAHELICLMPTENEIYQGKRDTIVFAFKNETFKSKMRIEISLSDY